jgi:tripartite ATP-independent transporter DctP family solute receptor
MKPFALLAMLSFAGVVSAQEVNLNIGHVLDLKHPVHLAGLKAAEEAAKRSNGRIKLNIFPASQLGSDREMLTNTQSGTIGGMIEATTKLVTFVPQFGVLDLPYLATSKAQAFRLLDSPVVEKELNARAAQAGFHIVGYWEVSLRNVYTRTKVINSVADLRGMKMRVIPSPSFITLFKALGANPTPMSFGELYTALQQGVVDGAENDTITYHGVKHFEVAKNLSLTNHMMLINSFFVNEGIWKKIPADLQQVLRAASMEGRKLVNAERDSREASTLAALKAAGVNVTQPDLKGFVDIGRGTYKEFEQKLGRDLIDKIVAAAK